MTLNDLERSFCVKIWFELYIQYVGVLAFGENCSEICTATHRLSAATKIYPTGDISVTGVCIRVTEEEAPASELYSHSQYCSHTCCSLISVENK